ncbi:hypothetical protein DJ564_16000 [Pseudomonas sp. 31-12]|nr:hypothetical protein DJ564_16000 [Pseudomonas sp. 31-12]
MTGTRWLIVSSMDGLFSVAAEVILYVRSALYNNLPHIWKYNLRSIVEVLYLILRLPNECGDTSNAGIFLAPPDKADL